MKTLLKPLIALAAIGLFASAVVHVCALLGIQNPFGPYAWALHVGIFVIWLPAVIVSNRATQDVSFKRKDFWTIALSGCPPWMSKMVKGLFVYALLNFGLFMVRTIGLKHHAIERSVELQGFSGH